MPDAVLLLCAPVSQDGVGGLGLGELVVSAPRARCALALADLVDLVDVLVPGVVPGPVGLARELRQAQAPGEGVWCHLAPSAQRLGKSLATNGAAVAVGRAGDIDLLVAPDDFEEARQALLRLGFNQVVAHWRGDEHASHQEELVRTGTLPVVVELHHPLALLTLPQLRADLSAG